MSQLPKPSRADPAELLPAYLRYYREAAIAKVLALSPEEQRTSRLESGWTPIELLNHLAHMERRWLIWGFLGDQVDRPWGDSGDAVDGAWVVDAADVTDVVRLMRAVGVRTSEILASRRLDAVARVGGRFDDFPPTLGSICFHVLNEYARHLGHLDIVVELAGGPTGE